jgi:hypothetical protein
MSRKVRLSTIRDLRRCKWERLPIAGYLLYPVGELGRVIGTKRFAAGSYNYAFDRKGKLLTGFTLYTREGLKLWKEKCGVSAQPITPTPASNEGEKVGKLNAA